MFQLCVSITLSGGVHVAITHDTLDLTVQGVNQTWDLTAQGTPQSPIWAWNLTE